MKPQNYPDLEIGLHRRDGATYTVELRFTDPQSNADTRCTTEASFDLDRLRGLALDSAAYGQELTNSLFADPTLRERFAQARGATGSHPLRVRLAIGETAQELHHLRWETLRDPQDGSLLLTSEHLLFSRYLSSTTWRPLTLRPRAALKALVLIANPTNLDEYGLAPLDVTGEWKRATTGLGSIPTTTLAREVSDASAPATLNHLVAHLRDTYDILSLVAHGALIDDEPHLWLERDDGTVETINGNDLVRRIQELSHPPRLVVLASCQSAGTGATQDRSAAALTALGPRLAEAGVPAVLAMQGSISMETVAQFMPVFFRELQRDGQVDRAVAAARGVVRDRYDWWMPLLFSRLRDGCLWLKPGADVHDVRGLANPYLGLQPFTYAERERYAGRERTTAAALEMLTTPGEQRVLLFITGASGSGKSSFAQAGSIPALEQHYGSDHLRHVVFRPSRYPLDSLLDGLQRKLKLPTQTLDPTAPPDDFFTFLADHTPPPHVLVIIIDQFEEVFTQSEPGQRDALFVILESLPLFQEIRTHIIATLRSDYLPELFQRKSLYEVCKQGIDLRVMDADELHEAIQRPIQRHPDATGKQLEPALLDKLAADAAEDAAYLPLLQVTLEDLWSRGLLKLERYGTLTDAIQRRAEEVYHFVDYDGQRSQPRSAADQQALLALLLDLVEVSLDDDPRRDVRRRRTLAELTQGTPTRARLIADLSTARLVSTSVESRDDQQVEVVDIIHESLIGNWQRLCEAIADQRHTLQQRVRFELALQEWQAHQQKAAYLLEGVRLSEAEALDQQGDVALCNVEAQELLKRSVARREAERQRKIKGRNQIIMALGLLLLLFTAVTLFWYQESNRRAVAEEQFRQEANEHATAQTKAEANAEEAQQNANERATAQAEAEERLAISEAQRLATEAQNLLETDSEVALLLASEAATIYQNDITAQTLRDAIDNHPWRVTHLKGNTGPLTSGVFSPDGQYILAASWGDGTAQLWAADGTTLATLKGHTHGVSDAVFSADSQHILTASADNTARFWKTDGTLLTTLSGHTDRVRSAVFSPDGQRILTASWDGTARLWALDGTPLATLTGHTQRLEHAIFSPDGQHILTTDETVRLWEWDADGQLLNMFSIGNYSMNNATPIFSPDGQHILTIRDHNTVQMWGLGGTPLATLTGHTGQVRSGKFSPDGEHILTASDDGTARLWTIDGIPLATFSGHTEGVDSAVFSPDGRRILTVSYDGTARLWDSDGTHLATLFTNTASVTNAVFSPDGQRIFTTLNNRTARLWDIQPYPLITSVYTGSATSTVFSPDGQHIFTASDDGTARLWSVDGLLLATFSGYADKVRGAVFSPDGQHLLTTSDHNTARLWKTDGTLLTTLSGHPHKVRGAVFSPDGQRILTASENTAWLWDSDGTLLAKLSGHARELSSLEFSPDGQRILTAAGSVVSSVDHSVRLWDAQGNHLTTLSDHTAKVTSARFSPDGQRILTASWDGTARLWALDGTHLATLSGHTWWVLDAVFSPDGQRIVTTSRDGTTRLWDSDGTHLITVLGHIDGVSSAEFSPDGQHVLTVSGDNTMRLWDVDDNHFDMLSDHTKRVRSARFSPDGNRILAILEDGTVRQYPINFEDLLKIAACRTGRTLTDEETARHNVPKPLRFDRSEYECPPVFSWESDIDSETKAKHQAARSLLKQGEELALQGDIELAREKFDQALEYDSELDIDPQARARELRIPALIEQGQKRAEEGDIEYAIEKFDQALKYDPDLDIDPQARAHQLYAAALIEQGKEFAQQGNIEEAIAAYEQAQKLDPSLTEVSVFSLKDICWNGSKWNQAEKILDICERAVTLAPDNKFIHSGRGQARALTGDYDGAIADFQFFIAWAGDDGFYARDAEQYEAWIAALEAGENPFDEETQEELHGE